MHARHHHFSIVHVLVNVFVAVCTVFGLAALIRAVQASTKVALEDIEEHNNEQLKEIAGCLTTFENIHPSVKEWYIGMHYSKVDQLFSNLVRATPKHRKLMAKWSRYKKKNGIKPPESIFDRDFTWREALVLSIVGGLITIFMGVAFSVLNV